MFDLLKTDVESVLRVKADLPKAINEFLEFVAYFSWSFLSSKRDVHASASELLYRQGGYFSEVHSTLFSLALLDVNAYHTVPL